MFIIDENGKIIEGQELTTEEASILKQLVSSGEDSLTGFASSYLSDTDRRRIALGLIQRFRLSRRTQPVEEVPEPHAYPEPIPPAPVYLATATESDDDLPL